MLVSEMVSYLAAPLVGSVCTQNQLQKPVRYNPLNNLLFSSTVMSSDSLALQAGFACFVSYIYSIARSL